MAAVLNMTDPYRTPKKNKHEIHWRAEPPEWGGNIDWAYDNLYGKFRVSL